MTYGGTNMSGENPQAIDPHALKTEWQRRLESSVASQMDMADDLLQMTTSPLAKNDPADWSLIELLEHPCPPVPWLQGVARFARAGTRDGSISRPISSALYLAAVAAALVHRQTYITRSSDTVLRLGFEEALSYDWLDRPTRDLIQKGYASIAKEESEV